MRYMEVITTSLSISPSNGRLCVLITKLFMCTCACVCFPFVFFFADHKKVADLLREAKHTQKHHFQVDQIDTTRQR